MSILAKLMEENPDLRAEIEAEKNQAFRDGKEAGAKPIKAMSKYLVSENYPQSIKEMAQKVIAGEMTEDAFSGAIAAFDAIMASQDIEQAAEETVEATPAQAPEAGAQDGNINTLEDMKKAQADARDRRGY